MKSSEEIMEAFDLTGGLRAAATLAGCDHKTVAHYVALRDAGLGLSPEQRPRRAMANQKTVTVEHVARVPIRHPDVVAAVGTTG